MVHGGSCYPGLVVLGLVGCGDLQPGPGRAFSEKLHLGNSMSRWVLTLLQNGNLWNSFQKRFVYPAGF